MTSPLFIERRPIDWADIKTAIFDLDDFLYDGDSAHSDIADMAKARAVCDLFPDMDYDEARRLSRESFEKYHDAFSAYIPFAEQHGETEQSFRQKIHYAFHEAFLPLIKEKRPDFFHHTHPNVPYFETLQSRLTFALLTHSCADRWAKPVLSEMNIRHVFQDEHILGYEQFNFKSKGAFPDAIALALERTNTAPEHALWGEDSVRALVVAKKHYPAITTVLRLYGPLSSINEEFLPYIDVVIGKPFDLLDHLVQIHGSE